MGLLSFVTNTLDGMVDTVSKFLGFGSPFGYTDYSEGYHSSTTNTTITKHEDTTYTYEPDRVRAAELENERVELMKRAKLEILNAETESRIAVERARAEGFAFIAQAIVAMQERFNDIAEKRIAIIERGSLQIIREAESFYMELNEKIREDHRIYSTVKLPELFAILEGYEEGSTAYNLYTKQIEKDMALQAEHYSLQLASLASRQKQLIDSIITSKERIAEQHEQIIGIIKKSLPHSIEPERDNNSLVLSRPDTQP